MIDYVSHSRTLLNLKLKDIGLTSHKW